MIEGLKIVMSSAELREHLLGKVTYHRDKQEFYEGQVASLRDGGVEENMAVSNDPIQSLEMSARRHHERSDFFQFLADHIVLDEQYQLTENDLTRLEIIGRAL